MNHNKINYTMTNMLLVLISLITIAVGSSLSKLEATEHDQIPIRTTQYNQANETPFEPDLEHFIIVTGEYEPYVYTEMGVTKGFEYEMMIKILDEMEIDYEIQLMSWSRGSYLLKTGDAFGTFPYSETAEREKQYIFTDSLIDVDNRKAYFYYYQKEDKPFELSRVDDLEHYKVGGIAGYYYTQIYDELGLKYDLAINELECFNKLKEGRIDTFPIDPIVAEAFINRYFPEEKANFKKSEFSFSVPISGDHLMINKEDPRAESFVARFNQALYKLRSLGILDAYGDEN